MEARAVAKWVRVGPRKVRKFLELVKGRPVTVALSNLATYGSTSTDALYKCIASAAANADNNHGMDPEELYVKTVCVDEGFRMPRIRPRARGRADRYYKPTSHITVVVSDEIEE